MLELVDIQSIKKKFATLLSKLYTDSKISVDSISDIIITNDFFDFLEKQHSDELLMKSSAQIARDLFNAESIFSEELVAELYWSGLSYMNISLNAGIPLRQVVLLCPLKDMTAHFKLYHEMNDIEIVKEFLQNEYQKSILSELRKSSGMSVRLLASCSGISETAIKYYEKDNKNLYKGSFENIASLKKVLNAPECMFCKRSFFVPYTRALMEDPAFQNKLWTEIDTFYTRPAKEYSFDGLFVKRTKEVSGNPHPEIVPDYILKKAFLEAVEKSKTTAQLLF